MIYDITQKQQHDDDDGILVGCDGVACKNK